MSALSRGLTVLTLLALPVSAHGFGFLSRGRPTVAYYYAPTVLPVYLPAYGVEPPCTAYVPTPVPVVQPWQVPTAPPPVYATPRPAPPSRTPFSPPSTAAPPTASPASPPSTPAPAPPAASPTIPPSTPAPPTASPTPQAPASPPPSTAPSLPVLPTLPPPRSGPGVSETRSYFDLYPVVPRNTDQPSRDTCSAGFWNLSGRDLTVKVNGQERVLAQGQSLSLRVGRLFTWQVEGRDPHTERIQSGDAGVEILLRR